MVGWSCAVFAVVRDHYLNFRLARFDLGNMVQAVWSTTHGRPLELTSGATGEQVSRLASHVDPILAALAPLWAVFPTPLALAGVQVGAVALGALPVFWLARRHLESERAAGILAFAYLAYPWVAWTAVDVFHPVTLGIPLLLFAIWFLDSDRLLPFAVCAVLTAASGELMAIVVAGLGVWYAVARGRRRSGLAIAALSVGWTVVALYVVVPAFADARSVFFGAYDGVGGSPAGIAETSLTDPGAVLGAIFEPRDLLYVLLLAIPVGGAFVLAPGLALLAVPQLGANVLADFGSTTDPHAHYIAGIVPFVFGAIAIGLGRVAPAGRVRGAVFVLTLSVAATIAAGPWPGALVGTPTFFRTNTAPGFLQSIREAVALVPEDAPVAATNRVGSHLSDRRFIYSVPNVGRAEWIVIDVADTWVPRTFGGGFDPEALEAFQKRIATSREWRKVFEDHGVLVYRRIDR